MTTQPEVPDALPANATPAEAEAWEILDREGVEIYPVALPVQRRMLLGR